MKVFGLIKLSHIKLKTHIIFFYNLPVFTTIREYWNKQNLNFAFII